MMLILLAGQLGCRGDEDVSPAGLVSSATILPAVTETLVQPAVTVTFQENERANVPTLEELTATKQPTDSIITATATPSPVVILSPTEGLLASCPPATGVAWAFKYGDSNFNMVDGIVPSDDDGVIFIGNGGAFIPGAYAVWAMKINLNGSVAWKKAYKGTTGDTTSVAAKVLPGRIVIANGRRAFAISEQDGSIIWQMSTRETGAAIDTPDGGFALVRENYVIKFNAQAQKAWQVSFDNGYWMWPTPKGEIFFARAFLYADTGSIYMPIYTDIEVIKVNAAGKIAWQKTYGKSMGDDETLDAMIPTQDGGVLLAGTHYGSGEVGETDIWVLKLGAGGSLSWQATLSGKWWDNVYRLAQSPKGEYFIAGYAGTEIAEHEVFVAKFKTNGTLAWQKTLSDYGSLDEITGLADGGVLISLADDSLLVRLDRSGKLVWEKTYESGQYLTSLLPGSVGLLLGGRSAGRAVMINLQDSGTVSGVIQVKDSNLKVSSSMGNRPNQKLALNYSSQIAVTAPGIVALDVDLLPIPLCLVEGGQQVVLTRTPTVTPVITPSPTPLPFTRTLYLTTPPMTGDDVFALQMRLQSLGYTEVGAPDGIFGALTDQAVRHFQRRNKLDVDGVVGPKTWERLFSVSAVRA